MTATVFRRVGPYEIVREIGRGGMAQVFLANDTRTSHEVALKLVPVGTDREALEVLEAEQLGATLQEQFCRVSPHVPAVYEHDIEGGYFYLAMEYLDGENLSDVISRGSMPAERAVAIGIELCHFLEAAHGFEPSIEGRSLRSLLHGDLKPRNVRIMSAGQVKVLDFGIAKALSLSRKVTRNDFGSISYLSPERLESGEIDAYADFWAVGVLLYEMASGVVPFQAPDTRRLEQRIRSRRPPSTLDGGCPVALQAIVAKLLGPDPTDRYASAQTIREDLLRFTAGQKTVAEDEGWPDRIQDELPTRRTRPTADTDEEATRRTSVGTGAPVSPAAGDSTLASGALQTQEGAKKPTRRIYFFRAALLSAALLLVTNETWVATQAGRLARTVPTRELGELTDVWSEYDALVRRSYLGGIGVGGLERALAQHTIALADRVIGNYRTPLPTVRETQWRATRESLARAVAVTPKDTQLKAALRYCDGHLHRINGEARKARHQEIAAQQEFTEAVTAFREAAELRPNWPDPFLGLGRTFLYGLEDVDRGSDALNHAQRLGYTLGERETAQLGDGYRARAEALVRTARKLGGTAQEQEYLGRAAEAYRQAVTLYAKAIDFSDVATNLRKAQRGLTQVEQRLSDTRP